MTTTNRVHKEALGIRVGDVITTSYGTGPFEVWSIYGPRCWDEGLNWIIWTWPVISLKLITTEGNPRHGKCTVNSEHYFSYINELRRENSRWFNTMGDEIFARPPRSGYPNLPVDIFLSYPPASAPYLFQDGVDYHAGYRRVWRCCRCGLDFNWEPTSRNGPPHCPRCNYIASTRLVMALRGESTYRAAIG